MSRNNCKTVTFFEGREDKFVEEEKPVLCKVKIYKLSSNMQRCPYIHEMKERLLGEQIPMETIIPTATANKKIPEPPPFIMDQKPVQKEPVATVVKLNSDGFSSHTSPTHQRTDRMPLMPKNSDHDSFRCVETTFYPKNAKTSLFIIMSFVYAKLLVVVCVAYVVSDVVTHNIPLYYYEGFFTYLYGMSILFLLYVFCFLLQESTCCSGGGGGGEKKEKIKKPPKEKNSKEKEKEKKKEEKDKKKEEKDKKKDKKDKVKDGKEKEKDKKKDAGKKQNDKDGTYRRNSEGEVDSNLTSVPVPVVEMGAQNQPILIQEPSAPVPPATAPLNPPDVEAGIVPVTPSAGQVSSKCRRKRKTTQNDQNYGSFFLRIGAIAFGLGTMIYNGLEFGAFFEIPFTSPCYMILRGVNPVLQMVFTFMQMYFIFMNSRLNIHRFKVIARFGLMHVAATNICVWIRTLVLEYLKEITLYNKKFNDTIEEATLAESIKMHTLRNSNTVLGTHLRVPDVGPSPIISATTSTTTTMSSVNPDIVTAPTTVAFAVKELIRTTASSAANFFNKIVTTSTTPATTTASAMLPTVATTSRLADESINTINGTEILDNIFPQAWSLFGSSSSNNSTALAENVSSLTMQQTSCERINIMGTIVQDSAPYLFPFIIEYSLIGAAVIYVMWKHIGRNPRYVSEEDLEHRLEIMLSRRAVAMAHAQHGRVDCVGASKGLFFGLLLLVGSLICLILFFVLIHHPDLGRLAIYLADVSHCALMALSIIAIIVGFIRVKSLKFRVEEQSDLNDILLRISAFGLFLYAVFSIIAGSLDALTKEPNLLVMITGLLAVLQVILQLLFIADVSRRRVHLPEHDRSKPGRQVVTFLLICNITMFVIYTFEMQKVEANPVQLEFYGYLTWAFIQRVTLPLCIFHRFHSAVTLAEIWKASYKARLE